MDEPESIGALTLAAREKLDNLTFIINCNLQRLDGPVRGNGQIIQELESLFTGAGWNVIKVLWGSDWDPLFARDKHHVLLRIFAATVDGQYQTLGANDGAYNQEHFFNLDPELQSLVSHMSVAEIDALKRGGHDLRKLYAAFRDAQAHHEPADGDPGEDEEGLRHGRRRRIAHDRAPAEEARHRRVARVPRPFRLAAFRRGRRGAAVLPPGAPTAARCAICASGGMRSAASCRSAVAKRRFSRFRRSKSTRASRSKPTARRCRRRPPSCA